MKNLVFLACIVLVVSITEHLPRNLKVKYYFENDEENITFEFWIPEKTMAPYGWVGMGLQDSRDARDNFRCDYYMAKTEAGEVFDDRFDDSEGGIPPLDTELGSTSDIISTRTTVDNFEVFVIKRKMDTEDMFDVPLYTGRPVLVKWALGNLDENGNFAMHTLEDMGFEYIVMEDSYEDRNHDERGKFGPWLEVPGRVINYPDDRNPDKVDWSLYLEDMYGRPSVSSTGEFASDGLPESLDLEGTGSPEEAGNSQEIAGYPTQYF